MLETSVPAIVEALLEALETMAFVTLLPAEPPYATPASARLITLEFTRPHAGSVALVAPAALGEMLAANLLGLEPGDEMAKAGGDDALKELINVTTGSLLNKTASTSSEPFQMNIPQSCAFDAQAEWEVFVAQESVQVLDVDGHIIAIRLIGME